MTSRKCTPLSSFQFFFFQRSAFRQSATAVSNLPAPVAHCLLSSRPTPVNRAEIPQITHPPNSMEVLGKRRKKNKREREGTRMRKRIGRLYSFKRRTSGASTAQITALCAESSSFPLAVILRQPPTRVQLKIFTFLPQGDPRQLRRPSARCAAYGMWNTLGGATKAKSGLASR